jgi:hypothetical protein
MKKIDLQCLLVKTIINTIKKNQMQKNQKVINKTFCQAQTIIFYQ